MREASEERVGAKQASGAESSAPVGAVGDMAYKSKGTTHVMSSDDHVSQPPHQRESWSANVGRVVGHLPPSLALLAIQARNLPTHVQC